MFLEVVHGIVRNLYNGAVAPEAPDGVEFVEIDPAVSDAHLGKSYADGVFTDTAESLARQTPAAPSRTVSKTAFLGALGPALVAAWFSSTDPILVFGRELFKADTRVDLDSAAIGAVLAQAGQLGLLTPEQAQAIGAALAVK